MKLNKTREELLKMYLAALKEEKIPWKAGWDQTLNHNPISKTKYRGVNRLLLEYVAEVRGYQDPRWATFNQISNEKNHPKQKWHLKKGSKAVRVELWKLMNKETGEYIDFEDYHKIVEMDPEKVRDYSIVSHCYSVFNFSCIEGVPEYKKEHREAIQIETLDEFCTTAIEQMGVSIRYQGSQAFYSPNRDAITMPCSDKFHSAYDFYATQLHEMGHATGHPNRLNRPMEGVFGDSEYAKEELRAEISSSFLMNTLGLPASHHNYDHHKSYIQHWISVLENNPEELFSAISQAVKIEDYLLEKGKFKELEKKLHQELMNEPQKMQKKRNRQLERGR